MNRFLAGARDEEEKENHQVLIQELQFRAFAIGVLAKTVESLILEDEKKEKKQ